MPAWVWDLIHTLPSLVLRMEWNGDLSEGSLTLWSYGSDTMLPLLSMR